MLMSQAWIQYCRCAHLKLKHQMYMWWMGQLKRSHPAFHSSYEGCDVLVEYAPAVVGCSTPWTLMVKEECTCAFNGFCMRSFRASCMWMIQGHADTRGQHDLYLRIIGGHLRPQRVLLFTCCKIKLKTCIMNVYTHTIKRERPTA